MNARFFLSNRATAFAMFTALILGVNSLACGELPSERYQQLKRNAQEILTVRLRNVDVKEDGEDVVTYRISADVQGVERSTTGLREGEVVIFESYHVKPEAIRRGFVGPQSPPQLRAGWTGRVYLSEENTPGTLGPAAYGQSFESLPSASTRFQSAKTPFYSVAAVTNRTNRTVTYESTWNNGSTESITLRPGETWRHWWECSPDCKRCTPQLTVSFRGSDPNDTVRYSLDLYRSQSKSVDQAKQYYFGWNDGYLDLFDPSR